MIRAAAAFAAAFSVAIPADPDGPLEPSVANEAVRAVERGLAAAPDAEKPAAAADSVCLFETNGLKTAEIAIMLVSRQRADGTWDVGGTNATAQAAAILQTLLRRR